MLRLISLCGALCLIAPAALAQEGGVDSEGSADTEAAAGDEERFEITSSEPPVGDDQALMEEKEGTEAPRSTTDPYEDPRTAYYFVGVGYRHSFTPKFLFAPFLASSPRANNPAVQLEITYRKRNFDIIGSLGWNRYHAYGPFRASGDPETDTEIIDSSLQSIMAGAAFLWSTPFSDTVAFSYGLDLGIGGILGKVNRTEAYPDSNGKWQPCNGPGDPANAYCGPVNPAEPNRPATGDKPASNLDGADGEHYDINARKWFNGGSVPNFWFRLTLPHLALRFKPIHQLMIRVDFGFEVISPPGFFVGGALAYGI